MAWLAPAEMQLFSEMELNVSPPPDIVSLYELVYNSMVADLVLPVEAEPKKHYFQQMQGTAECNRKAERHLSC